MIRLRILVRLLGLALAGAAALAPGTAQAATYTVTADRDSMLKEASPSENNGSLTELLVKNQSSSDEYVAIYGFTLPSIPAGETITSVSLRLWVRQSDTDSVGIHRVTDTWAESTVTWSNTGNDFNAAAEATFTPSPANAYVTINVTSLVQGWYAATYANNGVMVRGSSGADAKFTSREWSTSTQRPQLVITTATAANLLVVKSRTLASDPLNGTTDPKAIPGAVLNYAVTVTNSGGGTATNNSTVVTDAVPSEMMLYVGDYGAPGSGPVAFTNGSPSSGLTYTYTSLSSTTDSLSFSNDGGASFTYTPVPDADGYDSAVTHVRVNPSGTFAAQSGGSDPSFQAQMRMKVR